MKTAALPPDEAKSHHTRISSAGASSLTKRLHSFISPVRGDFISPNKKPPCGGFLFVYHRPKVRFFEVSSPKSTPTRTLTSVSFSGSGKNLRFSPDPP
jgi:hypothetical protein